MSSSSSNDGNQYSSKRHSTPKGLALSYGFTMSAEIKKKIRPISTPYGLLDNCEVKTIPIPNRIRPKSSINFSPNNKLTTKLIPPATKIDSKNEIKRKSQLSFQVKENYNYSNRSGSKIALFRGVSDKLPRLSKEFTDSSKYNKQEFSKRWKSENDTDSKNHGEDYAYDKEKYVDVELSDGGDTTCSEYGYGEALAVEEFPEIEDKFKVIDKTFDSIGMSVSLRDVLIKIDDSTFETLAAVSTTVRIEDETFPVDELFNLTDSDSDLDEPSFCVLELSRDSPELPPLSPPVVFFDEDYIDQLDLTFSTVHHRHEVIDEEFDGILSSIDSDGFIARGIHSSESLNLAHEVIDDEYSTINHNLFRNKADYYQMYNVDNHEALSETSESNDNMHDA